MPSWFQYVLYGLFFLILSEHITTESLIAALAAILMSRTFLTMPRRPGSVKTAMLPSLAFHWARFLVILLREILHSNIQVAKIVLNPACPANPMLNSYTSQLTRPALLTVFGTAITLTPGTMTVDISDSTLLIHCLNDTYANTLGENPLEPILLTIQEVLNG